MNWFKAISFALLMCLPSQALAERLKVDSIKLDVNTQKVSHLLGSITKKSAALFLFEHQVTVGYPGDRLLLIDSMGGDVDAGNMILDALIREKQLGTRLVCLVTGAAASMAFNILSNCDVRVSVKDAKLLFHHCALSDFPVNVRMTSDRLKEIAEDMERIDEKFCATNAKALRLSRPLYEKLANSESFWTAKELLGRKYLDAVIDTYQ